MPSQLMPANPVATLSLTPSSTEVITTSAKTPSISRVRVRIERSLCAQSSIRPPVTTSQTRASADAEAAAAADGAALGDGGGAKATCRHS